MPSPKTVTLNDGNVAPLLGFGTFLGSASQPGDKDKVADCVYHAIKSGYRHIDTAYIYGIEDKVGEGVKKAIDEGIVKRSDLFVVTKIWLTKLRPEKVIEQAKESLNKLGMTYVDCMLIHWPMAFKDIPRQPGQMVPTNDDGSYAVDEDLDIFTESWPAMEKLKADGLAKSIGVSNYNTKQIEKLVSVANVKPVMNQVECHPYLNQETLKKTCDKHGIVLTAYCPFGGNPRPTKEGGREENATRKSLWENQVIKNIAQKHNKKVSHVLIRFQIQRGIAVIPKSVTVERVIDDANVFDFELTQEDMASLMALNRGERIVVLEMLKNLKGYPFSQE